MDRRTSINLSFAFMRWHASTAFSKRFPMMIHALRIRDGKVFGEYDQKGCFYLYSLRLFFVIAQQGVDSHIIAVDLCRLSGQEGDGLADVFFEAVRIVIFEETVNRQEMVADIMPKTACFLDPGLQKLHLFFLGGDLRS